MFDLVVVRDAVERRTRNRLETSAEGRASGQKRRPRLGAGRALAPRLLASARAAAASMSINTSSSEASASIESSSGR